MLLVCRVCAAAVVLVAAALVAAAAAALWLLVPVVVTGQLETDSQAHPVLPCHLQVDELWSYGVKETTGTHDIEMRATFVALRHKVILMCGIHVHHMFADCLLQCIRHCSVVISSHDQDEISSSPAFSEHRRCGRAWDTFCTRLCCNKLGVGLMLSCIANELTRRQTQNHKTLMLLT